MGYLGRRIGLSQDQGDSNPGAAGGAVGGGILDLFTNGYFERQGDIYNAPGINSGLSATGGVISDYTDSGSVYRAHIFTSSGTFDVTAPGTFGDTVDYLVVGGGGGTGTRWHAGGGGGGGVLINPQFPTSTVPASQNRSGVTLRHQQDQHLILLLLVQVELVHSVIMLIHQLEEETHLFLVQM